MLLPTARLGTEHLTVKGILEEERREKEELSHGERKRESGKVGRELTWPRLEETWEGAGDNPVEGGLSRRHQRREVTRRTDGWCWESKGEGPRAGKRVTAGQEVKG